MERTAGDNAAFTSPCGVPWQAGRVLSNVFHVPKTDADPASQNHGSRGQGWMQSARHRCYTHLQSPLVAGPQRSHPADDEVKAIARIHDPRTSMVRNRRPGASTQCQAGASWAQIALADRQRHQIDG